jgi:hypothetical protein
MLDAISAEYYYRALVQELDREADQIYRAHQAQAEENSPGCRVLPFIPRPHGPFSDLRPRSVCR